MSRELAFSLALGVICVVAIVIGVIAMGYLLLHPTTALAVAILALLVVVFAVGMGWKK